MLLTFDDQFLLTVSEDGCLFTWKVFDKDGRGIKREREVGFAEEVLVTKTDMEEKVRIGPDKEGCGNSLRPRPSSWAGIPGPLQPRAFSARVARRPAPCRLVCSIAPRLPFGHAVISCCAWLLARALALLFLPFEGRTQDILFSCMTNSI